MSSVAGGACCTEPNEDVGLFESGRRERTNDCLNRRSQMALGYNCLTKVGPFHTGFSTVKMGAPATAYQICPDCRKCVVCDARVNARSLCTSLTFSKKIPAVVFFCPRHKEMGVRMVGVEVKDLPQDLCRKIKGYLVERRERMIEAITEDPKSSASQRLFFVNGYIGVLDDRLEGGHPTQQAPGQGIVREVVTKEIVEIPCKYCGTFLSVTESKCPNCGAPTLR